MTLKIDGKRLDDPSRVYVIAEISGNHSQDYDTAVALILAAAKAGADAVKAQTFTPEEIAADVPILTGHDAAHDAWIQRMGVTRLPELFAKGGLRRTWHRSLKELAESLGLAFLSTPFSLDAARFLVEEIGVAALKIASGDLTFAPLLEYTAATELPVLLSTGGAELEEIAEAVEPFERRSAMGRVALLHCVSVYPCPETQASLRCIGQLRALLAAGAYGWSDHTLSYDLVPALAVAQGATVLEKHLTVQRTNGAIDAGHSLEPDEFARMVEVVRSVPQMLGDGQKHPQKAELHDRLWARRSPKDWLRPTEAARRGQWE